MSTRFGRRALPWVLALYAAATVLHFAHNAEFLAQYPNLPPSWSRVDVYVAWFCLTTLGLTGCLAYYSGRHGTGLAMLTLYAALGFAGLLHYTRAPLAHHSVAMNLTILAEAAAASLLMIDLAMLWRGVPRSAATWVMRRR